MIAWYWAVITLILGGLITSAIEWHLKYNLTDEEIDILKGLYSKAAGIEKAVLTKIEAFRKAL
jgi:uncharacterized membrane protein YdbT with pleckstrin-like domain